ncbi:DUF559 domain-containing protein [Paenibacillus ferrarius]|uniref:DUF559 domain-containing protein n=1 Tax=Paenibacillus ferrarius TaxID=1469647 RepID=UPI003D2D5DE8
MSFRNDHEAWITRHKTSRSGERRGRLERGHLHGETSFLRDVWWPVCGNLEDLHPEYEVMDWRGRSYFADFMWKPPGAQLIIEIKGYAAHVRDMDRSKYCHELNRETFLHAMGYPVISFAYDDVEQRPELCQSLLRMVLSRYLPNSSAASRPVMAEKELLRLAVQQASCIRPVDVSRHFGIDHRTAVGMLKKLSAKGLLLPIERGKTSRVMQYALTQEALRSL